MAPPQGSFVLHIDSYRENSSTIFSETTGPIKAKFHMVLQWIGGTEVYLSHLGHMTKMAAMPMYDKNPLKIFISGTVGPMALELVMQHWGHRANKI